ncbi:serine hydrolase BPHL-like isoform X2 [Clavelina lepadiformis]
MYFEKVGIGEHGLLLLPGALGSTKTDFGPQLKKLNRKAFTIIGWDPRGYGQSRPPNKVFTTDFLQNDAEDAALLMKELGYEKYSLLGWSDGANVAAILSAKYPERVRKLVVWGGNSFITPEELEIYKKVRDVANWSPAMKQPMVDVYGEETFIKLWHDWVDIFVKMFKGKSGNVDLYMNELKKIKAQTLIVHGDKDAMVPKFQAEYLHKNIQGSRLVSWDDGKHNLHLKFADRFNALVEEFLSKDFSKL